MRTPIKLTARLLVATSALVLALIVPPTSAGFFDWFRGEESYVHDYDLLNSELVDHVRDEAALPNLLVAMDWLKMATGILPMEPQIVLPRKQALVQFTALLKLMDPDQPRCDLEAYTILSENDRWSGAEVLLPSDQLGPLRRIDAIINEVAVQHANLCRYVYPHLFQEALRVAPKQIVKGIKSTMDAIIATSKRLVFTPKDRYMDERQVAAQKAKGVSMTGYSEAVAVLLDLRYRSREDAENRFLSVKPDPRRRNRWIVNEPKVMQMLGTYVYSRCEFMNKAFDHIMRPAQMDQKLYARDHKYRAINDRTAEFMIWLQYYRLCNEILDNKAVLEENVINAIWSELEN